MPKSITGALAAAIAMASATPALAGDNAPVTPNAAQAMGPMQQQMMQGMMQQMQQCMGQMEPMKDTDQNAMRQQMMERMHGCMEQMMAAGGGLRCGVMMGSSGPDQGTEHKQDQHDHSGQ